MKRTTLKRKTLLKRTAWRTKRRYPNSYDALVEKLDRLFSRYIRRNHSKDGYVKCVTCGAFKLIKDMQAGHYIDRQHKSVRWDERNVWPQCKQCNGFHEGEKDEYERFLRQRYGPEVLEELNRAKHLPCRIDVYWLQEKIREYEGRLKTLDTL